MKSPNDAPMKSLTDAIARFLNHIPSEAPAYLPSPR